MMPPSEVFKTLYGAKNKSVRPITLDSLSEKRDQRGLLWTGNGGALWPFDGCVCVCGLCLLEKVNWMVWTSTAYCHLWTTTVCGYWLNKHPFWGPPPCVVQNISLWSNIVYLCGFLFFPSARFDSTELVLQIAHGLYTWQITRCVFIWLPGNGVCMYAYTVYYSINTCVCCGLTFFIRMHGNQICMWINIWSENESFL